MKIKILNLLTVLFLIALPYYLFEGKLYLGGDDTRLFYSYPLEFLTNVTLFSWYKVSSMGINGPSQYLFPFLSVWSLISILISNKAVLNYLALSLPLVLGLIFFQKAIRELFTLKRENDIELYLGSIFYVLSPILIINQMFVFLISIWLIGLIPIVVYYFLRYLKTSNFKYVFVASLWCLIFAFAIYAIPWLAGFILPIILGLPVLALFFKKREVLLFLKRAFIFFGFILVTQSFWLTGFVSTYLNLGQDSFASKFLSKGFVDTFTPTILSTATGNVIYPLLNLFHRQITVDFGWKLKDVFFSFYDKTLILNSFYVFVFAFGILNYKKYLDKTNKRIFIFLLLSFLFSLYFYTVNIGFLKDLFILFGQIPGFTMFRNFYDKFAPGYVMIYSTLISISLVILSKRFKNYRATILGIFFLIIIINFIPVKATVNSPLWTTQSTYKTITIPREYLNFMDFIKSNVSSSNNIFSIPFGSSVYTVIKDEDTDNAYVGVSPVKIFSGVNDISGHFSFNFTKIADVIDGLIINRKYSELNKIMYEHNINYVLVTKNIPKELRNSYVFNPDLYKVQDDEFIKAITSENIKESSAGNYILYKAKDMNSLINSKNVYFKKISQVKYSIYIRGLTREQSISLVDSYHAGWGLYLQKNPSLNFCKTPEKNPDTGSVECSSENELLDLKDFIYLFAKPVFSNTHEQEYGHANKWKISKGVIINSFSNDFYKENKDGSIDVEMILYFKPQTFFYVGVVINALAFLIALFYLIFIKKNEKN